VEVSQSCRETAILLREGLGIKSPNSLTANEYEIISRDRADNLKAETTRHALQYRLEDLPAALRRSVTFDNGKEFAEHRQLAQMLGLEVYFALPHHPWQRGTNENTNGLLRQFFPKGTDFSRISHQEVARVETLLNERPRRRLRYRTPAEVLSKRLCCN
jgi:IS30 family transposase